MQSNDTVWNERQIYERFELSNTLFQEVTQETNNRYSIQNKKMIGNIEDRPSNRTLGRKIKILAQRTHTLEVLRGFGLTKYYDKLIANKATQQKIHRKSKDDSFSYEPRVVQAFIQSCRMALNCDSQLASVCAWHTLIKMEEMTASTD